MILIIKKVKKKKKNIIKKELIDLMNKEMILNMEIIYIKMNLEKVIIIISEKIKNLKKLNLKRKNIISINIQALAHIFKIQDLKIRIMSK